MHGRAVSCIVCPNRLSLFCLRRHGRGQTHVATKQRARRTTMGKTSGRNDRKSAKVAATPVTEAQGYATEDVAPAVTEAIVSSAREEWTSSLYSRSREGTAAATAARSLRQSRDRHPHRPRRALDEGTASGEASVVRKTAVWWNLGAAMCPGRRFETASWSADIRIGGD